MGMSTVLQAAWSAAVGFLVAHYFGAAWGLVAGLFVLIGGLAILSSNSAA